MPEVRALGKRLLTLWVDMELYAKFANVAQARGVSMTELLTRYMTAETRGVKTTDAQNVEMLSRVKANGATPNHVIAAKEVEKRGVTFDPFDFVHHLEQYIQPEDLQKMRPGTGFIPKKKRRKAQNQPSEGSPNPPATAS